MRWDEAFHPARFALAVALWGAQVPWLMETAAGQVWRWLGAPAPDESAFPRALVIAAAVSVALAVSLVPAWAFARYWRRPSSGC